MNDTVFSYRSMLRLGAIAAILGAALLAWGIGLLRHPTAPFVFRGETMGTTYTVKVLHLPDGIAAAEVKRRIDAVLAEVNHRMSAYDPASEVSRWNENGEDWFAVSADTARVVAEALRVGKLSDGALDITVGPLVSLWRFGPKADGSDLGRPNEAQIASAKARVGYDRVDVELDPPRVRRRIAGGAIDLSAIAKGFGVDRVAELLEAMGVSDFMVEIGGEVRARGNNPSGTPWTIAIETPTPDARGVFRAVRLQNASMATSGDYRNYREIEGRRFCHLIDPRTGRPIEHRLASVSVIHPSCMTADAWATALSVLGPEAALRTAEEQKLDVLLILRTENGFECRATAGFESLMIDLP